MARDCLIDFESQETHFQFNPRLSAQERGWLERCAFPELPGHIWLASSGTTSIDSIKVLALSKRGFLVAAAAANTHLQSTAKDIWLNPLPVFHVGGLAVHARAFLSGARVISSDAAGKKNQWNSAEFVSVCAREKVTLASLVPTQVFDLVSAGLKAPVSLRAILVGGGALAPDLYFKARSLGWRLLPTYGMTEVCSQVATAPLKSLDGFGAEFPDAEILGHIEARVSAQGFLELRSEALFSAMGHVSGNGYVPAEVVANRWYTTNDICELEKDTSAAEVVRTLKFIGRAGDLIKVGGELVNLAKLNAAFVAIQPEIPCVFLGEADARLGERVVFVTELVDHAKAAKAVIAFNKTLAPFERVRGLYAIKNLPRSDLGKIKARNVKGLIAAV